jgi:YbbR domain-containing protein
MKAILLNHWQAKLTSLILAAVLWYLIKQGVGRTPERPSLSRPVPAETPKPPKKSPSK